MKLYRINKYFTMFIPSGTAMLNANVYFIKDEINTIIDTGTYYTLTKRNLFKILKTLGIDKIDRIILTHTHHDHSANVGLFQEIFNCEVLAHPSAIVPLTKDFNDFDIKKFEFLEFLENAIPFLNKKIIRHPIIQNIIKLGYHFYQGRIKPAKSVKPLYDGQIISCGNVKLEIIHTPGHSLDSICIYYAPPKIMFTGDTIPFTPYLQTSISDIINSVHKIFDHSIRFVFRGHGYRPHPWCEEYPIYLNFLDSIQRAEKRILIALKLKGPLKISKIVPLMYERTHIGHYRFYKLMRTDFIWALKYLQDLIDKNLVENIDGKYYLKNRP
ncbi:MAG: MBL fold metallo-hydrolase [Candidatus Helarchaeota archaeon]